MAKLSASAAGYMELTGARKDGQCSKVDVANGISLERGCCNEFERQGKDVTQFKCGTCEYHERIKAPKPPSR